MVLTSFSSALEQQQHKLSLGNCEWRGGGRKKRRTPSTTMQCLQNRALDQALQHLKYFFYGRAILGLFRQLALSRWVWDLARLISCFLLREGRLWALFIRTSIRTFRLSRSVAAGGTCGTKALVPALAAVSETYL
jgi:hypothetical protein